MPEKALKKVKKQSKPRKKSKPALSNRMMGYGRFRRPPCPVCDAFPVVCSMKRNDFAVYRCRVCGHRWTTGEIPGEGS